MTQRHHPSAKAYLWALTMIGGTVLLGCSEPSKGPSLLEDYTGRLGRALDTSGIEAPLVAPPRINDADLAALPIPSSDLGMLDFLALSGCELQVNIGRRNSSLGRNASASQQLLLDVEFLALAPPCIAAIKDEQPELARTLETAQRNKQQQLSTRLYNAILAGPEYRQFWSLPRELGDYPDQTAGDVIDSLDRLLHMSSDWLEGNYRLDYPLELDLSVLRQGDGGDLLLAAVTQERELTVANGLLEQRLEARPLCPGGRKTEAATITETVVLKYFTQDVQEWLTELNRRQHQLLRPIQALERILDGILPSNYRHWQTLRNQLLDGLGTTPKAHVSAIKKAFAGCPEPIWQVN